MTSSKDLDYRPSYLAAGIASLLVFILYLLTLGPSTAMWDTSEYITAAYVVGLPHPPGNPFFVLLGRFFSLLPIGGTVAMRVNILAATCSAISAGVWFLVTERVLVSWFAERWQRIVGGALASLIGATAFTVWSQSVVNEKVYTVALVGVALQAWLTVRWCDEPDGTKADRLLVLIAYLLGLGYANHMAGFLTAPAIATAVLIRRPRTLIRWRLILACLGALTLGATPFATQPIRSAYFPELNEGETTGCRTKISVDCTLSKETWRAFKYNFNREQYGKPPLTVRQAPFSAQIGMWWLYFKWQWVRDAHDEMPRLQAVLAAVFLILGLFGGYVHYKRDRQSFSFFGPLMFTMTLLLIYYLNFKYGASQSPELGETVDREVRDRDYFYLWSFSAWSVWAALGLAFVWESVAAMAGVAKVQYGKNVIELPTKRSWLLTSPMLAVAFIPLFANWGASTRKGDTTTVDFAKDLLNSVEPNAIVVTVGDNDTFPLWYAQEVEGVRQDVVIANTSLLNTDWYTRQMLRNPIRAYDKEKGPAMYRNGNWPMPTKPPFSMTMEEADSVPLGVPVKAQSINLGGVEASVPEGMLTRADIFVMRMIGDNTGRPIYFSRTTGTYGETLGLGKYLLTQGLARKLLRTPIVASGDTVPMPGEGFIDVGRTKALWDSVFAAKASLIRKGDWIDVPSASIPALYATTGLMLADALRVTGDSEASLRVLRETGEVARATRMKQIYGFDIPQQLEPMPQDLPKPLVLPDTTRVKGRPSGKK